MVHDFNENVGPSQSEFIRIPNSSNAFIAKYLHQLRDSYEHAFAQAFRNPKNLIMI